MSRVLPNAIVGRAFRILGVRNERLEADLPKMVDVGRQKLYGFQHEDGGWGWWFDDLSDDYQSAYILYGLALTEQAGYEIDDGVMQRGADYLRGRLPRMDARTRAYALYALATAGHGEPETARLLAGEVLAGKVTNFDSFSRAALALALHEANEEEPARRLIDSLIATAVVREDVVYWNTGLADGHYEQKTMSSSVRSTALALDALVQVQPKHAWIPSIVRWLMQQRSGYAWSTTQETSYALLALADYVLSVEQSFSQQNYRLDVNGQTVAEGTFASSSGQVRVVVPGNRLQAGENVVRLLHSGNGRLYYTVIARSYTRREAIAPAGAIGVRRSYRRPGGGPITAPLRVGDVVEVQLTITLTEPAYYLILNDALPAGLEGLNERLATTSYAARQWWEPAFQFGQYPYNRKDVRDDGVALFFGELAAGRHTFTYLARATTAGVFHALPAEAYPMYRPEVWGRSAGDIVPIKP